MKYILNENIALRSWQCIPYICYIHSNSDARRLEADEFEFLSQCDGNIEHNLSENKQALIERFLSAGFIRPVKHAETLSDLQKAYFYNNQCFPAMEWMITGKCNYNCLHCLYAADNASSMSEWTLDEAEKLLDEAQKCQIRAVSITGGEPLLHKYLFEIIESLCRRNIIVQELNTNGQFISRNILNWLKEIGCYPTIKISFDGIGHHDWLRNQKDAQKETLHAIHMCLENGFRVKVVTNVHRRNVSSILPTAELLDEMGVEEMCIVRTEESARWLQKGGSASLETGEYYDCMLEFLRQYINLGHTMAVDIRRMLSLLPKLREYRIHLTECRPEQCRAVIPLCRQKIVLTPDGRVFPCQSILGCSKEKNNFLGNAKTESLHTILEREKCMPDIQSPDFRMFFEKGYYNRLEQLMKDWQNTR